MRPRTLAQWKIPYEIAAQPMPGMATGLGGVAVASRAFRGMRLPGACEATLGRLRRIAAGYTSGQIVETAVLAVMLGADCVEDIDRLREDPAVEKMLGYKPAEANAVLATEFRDGNVPADRDPLNCTRAALAQLPASVNRYAFRGDSACDNGAFPCRVQPTG